MIDADNYSALRYMAKRSQTLSTKRTVIHSIIFILAVRLFETGIKVVDLLTPYKSGGKIELFGGAGVGKTVVIMELILNELLT